MIERYELVELDNYRLNARARAQQETINFLQARLEAEEARTRWYIMERSGVRELERMMGFTDNVSIRGEE